MKKLNQKKIKWIVREGDKRDMGFYTIAHIQGITPRWAREVHRKYKGIKDHKLLPCGRKPKPIEDRERKIVRETFDEYFVGATMMELILDDRGVHIPHNKIHKILLEEGLAKPNEKKQKRRKYIRWQRKHSLSLFHGDWFEYKGQKFILIEDDASRFVTGSGKFKHATEENTFKVFRESLKWGKPKQFYSDNGSVFRANEQEGKKTGETDFQKELKKLGIKQIFTRIKHPQGNGKMEKLGDTIMKLWDKLGSFEKAVEHYNYKKPHWSLTNKKPKTPYQAFLEKMRK